MTKRQTNGTPVLLTLGIGLLTLVVAGTIAWVVFEILRAYQSQITFTVGVYQPRTVTALRATRIIGAGTVITEDAIEPFELEGSYLPLAALTDPHVVVGRVVGERILPGELIRRERLAIHGTGQGLNALVPQGMRAIAVNLLDGDQVSGFIEPGNIVDLIATVEGDEERPAETVTVLQAVRVLAVDERISETATGELVRTPQVTMLVNPELAEKTTHALGEAKAKLTLRSDIDLHQREVNGVVSDDLLGSSRTRMTVTEFRETFSEDDVWRMVDLVAGKRKVRERVGDVRAVDLTLQGFGASDPVQVQGIGQPIAVPAPAPTP